jgi:hypothetical protein
MAKRSLVLFRASTPCRSIVGSAVLRSWVSGNATAKALGACCGLTLRSSADPLRQAAWPALPAMSSSVRAGQAPCRSGRLSSNVSPQKPCNPTLMRFGVAPEAGSLVGCVQLIARSPAGYRRSPPAACVWQEGSAAALLASREILQQRSAPSLLGSVCSPPARCPPVRREALAGLGPGKYGLSLHRRLGNTSAMSQWQGNSQGFWCMLRANPSLNHRTHYGRPPGRQGRPRYPRPCRPGVLPSWSG